MRTKEGIRFLFFLPNIFTALNMACGFGSILLSFKGAFYESCLLLILGGIFDMVDGRIARLTGTQSIFGEHFDSLSDLVSFGVGPAFLIYNKFLFDYGRIGMVFSFIFVLCGALRLARFNTNIEKVSSAYFQGLPIPGAAVAMAGLVLITLEYPVIQNYRPWVFVYTIFYSLLMISNVPFFSFKGSASVRAHKKIFLVLIFFILALLVANERIMIFSLISLYVFGCLIYYGVKRKELKKLSSWDEEHEP